MINNKLKIGMDYEEAKTLFTEGRKDVESTSGMKYFTVSPVQEAYGMYPAIQVVGKNGRVVEILITPDPEVYGDRCGEGEMLPIWESCVEYACAEYGAPYKERERKKAWLLPDGVTLKIKIESLYGNRCAVSVLYS